MTPVSDILEAVNGMALLHRLDAMSIEELMRFAAKCGRLHKLTTLVLSRKLKERREQCQIKKAAA